MIVSIASVVFPRLPVADDQLPLASPDGGQGVDDFQACLQGFLDVLSVYNTWSFSFDNTSLMGRDWSTTIDSNTECIHNAASQGVANRDGGDLLGASRLISFFDCCVVARK